MSFASPRSHSMKTYLYLGVGGVATLFALTAIGLRAYVVECVQQQAEARIRSQSRTRAQQALLLLLQEEEVGLTSYLASGDPTFLDLYEAGIRAEGDAIQTTRDNFPERFPELASKQMSHLEFLIGEWHARVAKPHLQARYRGPLSGLRDAIRAEHDQVQSIKGASETLQRTLDAQDERHLLELEEALSLARWISMVSYAVALLAGLAFARWILRQVAGPLSDLAEQARNQDGFPEPAERHPVREVDILGRALYDLDRLNRERETVLRWEHDEALATRAFAELVQHFVREEELVRALDQALTRHLQTTGLRILLRPEAGDGMVQAWPPMPPEEVPDHPVLVDAGLCRAIRQGAPVSLAALSPTACLCPLGVPCRGSYLCLPLVATGRTLGLVNLQARNPEHWTPQRRSMAEGLVSVSAAALQAIRALDQARERSIRDALTGIYNRRFLDEFLPKIADQATRKDFPLSLLMLDIDHFKAFNDELGHEAGDQVLRLFAQALQLNVRGGDVVARYGGEEFAILLPHAGPDLAQGLGERLRKTIHHLALPDPPFPPGRRITVSIGLASFPDHTRDTEALVSLADQALYEAKGNGRNCIISAGDLGQKLLLPAD